jgi:hypothetical protein
MEKMDTKLNGACTIVSPNYLPFARTLAKSYLQHHPKDKFFVLVVAKSCEKKLFGAEPFSAVVLEEIGLPNLDSIGMRYDVLELNTNVKPSFMKYIFDNSDLDSLVYLDPDIYIYNRLDPVFELLEHANVVLTPHITSPIDDSKTPREQDFLLSGTYNLGFIAVRRSSESKRMLDWWESRCLEQGYNETRTGLFVDQKWINLAPCLFEKVEQCKDHGCNVAYWNLHERNLTNENSEYVVNGNYKLRFFHFSGVDINRPEALSKYTNRFDLQHRKDLADLFATYKMRVTENRNGTLDTIEYGFDFFDDGVAVTQLARRIFASCEEEFLDENPFSISSKFYYFAKQKHLIGTKSLGHMPSWSHYDSADQKVVWVHRILRATLFLLRSNRYELLMKYLGHISVLRQQRFLVSRERR